MRNSTVFLVYIINKKTKVRTLKNNSFHITKIQYFDI